WFTVSVNAWVACGATPLEAVIVTGYEPPVPAAGVPDSVPLAASVTPDGSVPVVTAKVGAGKPVPATVNVPAVPTAKVVATPLVNAGGWLTVSVKFCVPLASSPALLAVIT